MSFDPIRAAIRFGDGLSPDVSPAGSAEEMLALLQAPDEAAKAHPIPPFETLRPTIQSIVTLRREARRARNTDNADEVEKTWKNARRAFRNARIEEIALFLGRSITTRDGFRERLTRFWTDHFTVKGRNALTRGSVMSYAEETIRPHLTGRFEVMLDAVMTHPMMLDFLDQARSIGPNSPAGANGRRGINENLARELLELHTLGVTASYSQRDVRELAELLTGLSFNLNEGFQFRTNFAEPGAEEVLGARFGGGAPSMDDIRAGLRHLARHPETARHLSRKLAVHFVSDRPDPALVDAMAAAYLDTDGALLAVYEVMLAHPASWTSFGEKVKQPIDFVASGYRALAVPPKVLKGYNAREFRTYFGGPMAAMGQPWLLPDGPDGWPEDAEAWITPQGLAARVQWAMAAPSAIFRSLPDPRAFLDTALGGLADERLTFAATSAETRREGVGLVLASPAFQRR